MHNSLYLCNLNPLQFNFVDKEFKPVSPDKLNGLFAYIFFRDAKLLVISNLIDYQSNHAGINLIQKALRKQLVEQSLYKPIDLTLSRKNPDFGGEMLLLGSEIIFWNFKSRSYSERHEELNDKSLQLKQQVKESGLPPKRFISIKTAQHFEMAFLKIYFAPNGQYQHNPHQAAHLISLLLGLPPLTDKRSLQGVQWQKSAGSKDICSPTMHANSIFSFFNRNSEDQALLSIESDSPKL